jgi:hypothetical protein
MNLGTIFRYGPPLEFIDDVSLAGAKVAMLCVGQAGTHYVVERGASLATGGLWETVRSTNAPALGRFLVLDQNPPSEAAYYRMKR